MRLFFKLSEKEQNDVLNHCANIVTNDMVNGEITINPINDEEIDLKEKLESALKDIKSFEKMEDKYEYFANDPVLARAIYDLALEMAKSAIYCNDDELVIYPSVLANEDQESFEEVEDEEIEEEVDTLPPINTKTKKTSELN